jgi:hypothetical protein
MKSIRLMEMLEEVDYSRRDFLRVITMSLAAAEAAVESKYDDLEERLAKAPVINVPTIILEGDANGAPHPDAGSYGKKFPGKYRHRIITGGIGQNLPQEAPH